jgi:hypothetical protein
MLGVQYAVFILFKVWTDEQETLLESRDKEFTNLSSRIYDFYYKILAVVAYRFAERVLYGGIVAFDELPLDEPHSKGRFS